MTRHSALYPQVPGQGSIHLFCEQAKVLIQSELTVHSGRQPEYGSPKYSLLQVQTQVLPRTDESALDPHGFGLQGSLGGGGAEIVNRNLGTKDFRFFKITNYMCNMTNNLHTIR